MVRAGIPKLLINSLLSRVRQINTLVIADRGFPYWPQVEMVDISFVDYIPPVIDVLRATTPNFAIGNAWMAAAFREHNSKELVETVQSLLPPIHFETHADFKRRLSTAIGLIRTAGASSYSNVIIEFA